MPLDLGLLFPIRDGASAELMAFKAACLWNAGIINGRQRQVVEQRAQRFLARERRWPRSAPTRAADRRCPVCTPGGERAEHALARLRLGHRLSRT